MLHGKHSGHLKGYSAPVISEALKPHIDRSSDFLQEVHIKIYLGNLQVFKYWQPPIFFFNNMRTKYLYKQAKLSPAQPVPTYNVNCFKGSPPWAGQEGMSVCIVRGINLSYAASITALFSQSSSEIINSDSWCQFQTMPTFLVLLRIKRDSKTKHQVVLGTYSGFYKHVCFLLWIIVITF